MAKRKLLVCIALPYANGMIHLGHMVEHIQGDIWVRLQRLLGHDVKFISGEDAHGTPIMISAQNRGITPEELIAEIKLEHERDFRDFHISYDHYYTTHSPENKVFAEYIYTQLRDRGDIETRTIKQCYDLEKQMFLPDRFVKGNCPRCGTADQYGDNCESCGATYTPAELKNPVSVLSGTTPVEKESLHYFFKLENYESFLKDWIHNDHLQPAITKKLDDWFEAGLQQWDISRDSPYFGFQIPETENKYFYVWLDAPIGYMATFKNYCISNPQVDFDEYWKKDSNVELYHFVGKDIIYFHALFWPAMLQGSGFRTPNAIFAHGFLTVNGKKMSKSRGTFITARQYLDHLDPDYIRYYFAAKLGSSIDDIDLNFEDFVNRVNSDLVGKFVNIASRCAGFIHKKFDGMLSSTLCEPELFAEFLSEGEKIKGLLHDREYNTAIRSIMTLADKANQYIADKAPWTLAKQEDTLDEVQQICTMGLNLFRQLALFLKPITPALIERSEQFLNNELHTWDEAKHPLLNHKINEFQSLIQRIESTTIDAIIQPETV